MVERGGAGLTFSFCVLSKFERFCSSMRAKSFNLERTQNRSVKANMKMENCYPRTYTQSPLHLYNASMLKVSQHFLSPFNSPRVFKENMLRMVFITSLNVTSKHDVVAITTVAILAPLTSESSRSATAQTI